MSTLRRILHEPTSDGPVRCRNRVSLLDEIEKEIRDLKNKSKITEPELNSAQLGYNMGVQAALDALQDNYTKGAN